jgi:hypothetical protein
MFIATLSTRHRTESRHGHPVHSWAWNFPLHMFQDLASKDDWPVAAGMMLADWDVILTTSGDKPMNTRNL